MKENIKKTGKIGIKTTNIILSVAILLLLPVIVFVLISSRTNRLGGIQSFVVITGSMYPKLPVGSVIFTRPNKFYNLHDVIAFNRDGKIITHRIVKEDINDKGVVYSTKGDANNIADSQQVLGTQIVGKEIFVIPVLGDFIRSLSTPKGFALFIMLPILVFVCFELWNIKKEFEKHVEAKYIKKMQMQGEI